MTAKPAPRLSLVQHHPLVGLLSRADPTFRVLFKLGAVEVPTLHAQMVDTSAIAGAAERLAAAVHPKASSLVEELLTDLVTDRRVHDAVADRLVAMAEAGFVLGVLSARMEVV